MKLFFSFNGRITRQQFWTGILALLSVTLVMRIALALLETPMGVGLIISLPLFYIYAALLCKRLQDRDRDPALWLAVYLLPVVGLAVLRNLGLQETQVSLGFLPERLSGVVVQTPALFVTWIAIAMSVWAVYDLGTQRGSRGENRYGTDPLPA
ncbi:MAG: DUF805 domain-containing protein [Pseudomonadota bacterium]